MDGVQCEGDPDSVGVRDLTTAMGNRGRGDGITASGEGIWGTTDDRFSVYFFFFFDNAESVRYTI